MNKLNVKSVKEEILKSLKNLKGLEMDLNKKYILFDRKILGNIYIIFRELSTKGKEETFEFSLGYSSGNFDRIFYTSLAVDSEDDFGKEFKLLMNYLGSNEFLYILNFLFN